MNEQFFGLLHLVIYDWKKKKKGHYLCSSKRSEKWSNDFSKVRLKIFKTICYYQCSRQICSMTDVNLDRFYLFSWFFYSEKMLYGLNFFFFSWKEDDKILHETIVSKSSLVKQEKFFIFSSSRLHLLSHCIVS